MWGSFARRHPDFNLIAKKKPHKYIIAKSKKDLQIHGIVQNYVLGRIC